MFTKQLERFRRPSTDLDKYDDEEYTRNPLLKLNVCRLNEQRRNLFFINRAGLKKLETCQSFLEKSSNADFGVNRKQKIDFTMEDVTMPTTLEEKLESYVPKLLKEKYPHEYGILQTAVEVNYKKLMLDSQFKRTNMKSVYEINVCTEFHERFLATRSKLAEKLLIVQKPVRSVLNFSVQELPKEIFNLKDALKDCRFACFKGCDERRAVSYRWLLSYFKSEIDKMNDFLRWIWYPKIIRMLKQQFFKTSSPDTKLLKCIEGLISREIMKIKQVWLSNLLNELANPQKMPILQFKLEIVDYEIQLNPNFSKILDMCSCIVLEIANIGVNKLPCLEFEINMGIGNCLNRFINLEMDEIYIGEYIADLKDIIRRCLKPLDDYLKTFKAHYACIIKSADIDHYDFLAARHHFEHYITKMLDYCNYKNELLQFPHVEYFMSAIVETSPAVSQLISAAQNFMKLVVDEMTAQHINYLKTICTDYEKIKACVCKEPESTEELLYITSYMNLAQNQYLNQLDERVRWARHIGNQLLEFTDFSQYHLNLYVITLNWVHEIKLVYEESTIQLQYFTEVFKKHLDERINKLNQAIEDMYYTVDLLRDIKDTTDLKSGGKNAIFLQNIIARLKEFDDAVLWINKEENLFNIIITKYPKLQEIKMFVSKYAEIDCNSMKSESKKVQ